MIAEIVKSLMASHATALIGHDQADRWMRSPSARFHGQSPQEVIDHACRNVEEVEHLIERVARIVNPERPEEGG